VPWYVYTLSHPTTTETQYVGITGDPASRYRHHLSAKGRTRKDRWIRKLLRNDLIPKMEIVDVFDTEAAACIREIELIVELRRTAHNLMNSTCGGSAAGPRPKREPDVR
jgi:predicted GIY-YIG superfamily endonuclease